MDLENYSTKFLREVCKFCGIYNFSNQNKQALMARILVLPEEQIYEAVANLNILYPQRSKRGPPKKSKITKPTQNTQLHQENDDKVGIIGRYIVDDLITHFVVKEIITGGTIIKAFDLNGEHFSIFMLDDQNQCFSTLNSSKGVVSF